MDPNADLVQRAIARDPEAVRQLVKSLGPAVRGRIAKALMRRRGPEGRVAQEVEDLAQEVFLALFDHGGRALRAWDPQRGPLGAFVALIADHQVFSIFRSGKRRPWTDDLDILTAPAATAAEAKETLDMILDRLRADLSVRGFDLFTHLYVEEQSVEAVSAELGMSADAIDAWRSRLSKVVKTLAAQGNADDKNDFALLKQLGARAREERAEPVDAIPALDAAAEERIAGRLLERVRDSLTHGLAAPKPARVVAHPLRWMIVAVPLVAGAALVLFVATRGSSVVAPPAYEMSLVSVNGMRDPSSAKVSDADFLLDPSGELELVARPAAPVKNAHARAFLLRSGDVKPWLVPLQMSDEGAVRITGMTRLLFPTTNDPYDVVIFVAAGDFLPSDADAQHLASGAEPAPDAKYRVVRGHIRFAARTTPTTTPTTTP